MNSATSSPYPFPAKRGVRGSQISLAFDLDNKDVKGDPVQRTNGLGLGVTFKDSLEQGPFGWYPYVEGFSANYARAKLRELKPRRVYDPFGGSGTTCLAAGIEGVSSAYAELNPLMRFVTEVKTNSLAQLVANRQSTRQVVSDYLQRLSCSDFPKALKKIDLSAYHEAFPNRDFFVENDLRKLLVCLEHARAYELEEPHAANLLKLAVVANAVKSSNMTRRADLRRRRDDEYKSRVVDVPKYVEETVCRMMLDIETFDCTVAPTECIGFNAKNTYAKYDEQFDCVLTSPPYLNGTNYFRNTKIELWLLGLIETEIGIRSFNKEAVAGGIDNVRSGSLDTRTFDEVERVAKQLEAGDGDRRIPRLIRQYFSDMHQVFVSVKRLMTADGLFILDIGDSKFYGVHVPTDRLLSMVAEDAGLRLTQSTVLARRHSRDKSPLVQMELEFCK